MWRPAPTAAELMEFTGAGAAAPHDDEVQALAVLTVVLAIARAYTRGRGFHPTDGEWLEEDIAAVVLPAAARLLLNPASARRIEVGSFSTVPGVFEGWTLAELAVLQRYRRRAA